MKIACLKSITLIVFILLSIFTSCKKEQPTYTCNPQLNQWAVNNYAKNGGDYTRSDLVAISSLDTQGALYATLTPEAKCAVWKEKFQLAKALVSSDAEKQYLQVAIDKFQPSFWTSKATLDAFRPWADNWGQQAMQQFGWDSTKLFIIAETWLMPEELRCVVDHYNNTPHIEYMQQGGSASPACACRYSAACQWFVQSCDSKCDEGAYTCGISGTAKCTGVCVDNVMHPVDPNNPAQQDTVQRYYIH